MNSLCCAWLVPHSTLPFWCLSFPCYDIAISVLLLSGGIFPNRVRTCVVLCRQRGVSLNCGSSLYFPLAGDTELWLWAGVWVSILERCTCDVQCTSSPYGCSHYYSFVFYLYFSPFCTYAFCMSSVASFLIKQWTRVWLKLCLDSLYGRNDWKIVAHCICVATHFAIGIFYFAYFEGSIIFFVSEVIIYLSWNQYDLQVISRILWPRIQSIF